MANALVHETTIEFRRVVESVGDLKDALSMASDGCDDELDATYVVETVREVLSDKSTKYSVRIREAEEV